MQLEVGKKYINRRGEIREIIKEDPSVQYPFLDSRGKTYLANGRYAIQGGQSEDLVEEVSGPAVDKPTEEPPKRDYTFDNLLDRVEALNAKIDEVLQMLTPPPEKKEPKVIEVQYHEGLNRYLFFCKGKQIKWRLGSTSISKEIETLNHWLQYAYNKGLEDASRNRP